MRKKRPHYAPEFRRQMVELVRAGRSPAELENEFEPTAQTIRKWVAQGDLDEGPIQSSLGPQGLLDQHMLSRSILS